MMACLTYLIRGVHSENQITPRDAITDGVLLSLEDLTPYHSRSVSGSFNSLFLFQLTNSISLLDQR